MQVQSEQLGNIYTIKSLLKRGKLHNLKKCLVYIALIEEKEN